MMGERTGPWGRKGRIDMKRDDGRDVGLEALDRCEYMVLSVNDVEGLPYCMPLYGFYIPFRKKITHFEYHECLCAIL